MKARTVPCLRQSTLPLRSLLNKRSTFHFGRCWTRGLHSVPVVAGQAPLALSNTGTQQHWRLAPRNPASKYSRFPLPGGNSCSYFGVIKCADTGSSKLAPAPAHLIAFIVNFHAALVRGTTTDESQMVPCLRHYAICRRYVYVPLRSALNACRRHAAPCFTFRLRRNSHSYRLVGKCPRIRPSELARLCVRLPSFHCK